MAKKKDANTEEKILDAARKVFMAKGYAGTRTRDIAEEADINLALLNYYFRSKQKLFNLVMAEKMQQFFSAIIPVLNDKASPLETKVQKLADTYLSVLQNNPNLAMFVLNEIRNNPKQLSTDLGVKNILLESDFIQQFKQRKPEINPIHFFLNLLGMLVFPFIGKPFLEVLEVVDDDKFDKLIEERKKMIPLWIDAMLAV